MSKIIFVKPPDDIKKTNNYSIGLFSLGTILKKNGYSIRIIDFDYIITESLIKCSNDNNENIEFMCDYILKENPDIVDFYTMGNSYYLSVSLAKKLKNKNKNLKIIFGGPQASLIAGETLKACPWIDVIGIGEGELSILNIVDNLLLNKKFTTELGVAYLRNGKVICNESILIKDLDTLPKLDYSLLEGNLGEKIQLEVGRGCPFGCKYCSTKTFWKRNFRLKSSERIIDEISELKNKFDIDEFEFEHDLFTANRNRILDFCDNLIKNNIKITWRCSSRADTLDEEMIKKMSEAGCTSMYLGIESGSKTIQKIINKNLDLDKALNTMKLLNRYNIHTTASFIYGFPEESEDDVNLTIQLIYKMFRIGVNAIQLHLFSLYPGSEYWMELKDKLYFSNVFSDGASSKYIDLNAIDFIEKNKNIFPEYLDFDIGIRKKLEFLDMYVYIYCVTFMKYMNKTYELLVSTFGSHLEFFKRFRKANYQDFESHKNLIYKMHINPQKSVIALGNLIDNIHCPNKNIISEMYKFESDIVKFIYYSNKVMILNRYKCNVYEMKMHNLDFKSANYVEDEICFTRLNNKNDINIKKVI